MRRILTFLSSSELDRYRNKMGVSTKFGKVAKTSKGPIPQSFWISDVKNSKKYGNEKFYNNI